MSTNFKPPFSQTKDEPTQPTLATFFCDADGKIQRSTDDIRGSLTAELSMSRLNDIHNYLWLAGRPTASRPLHWQALLGRTIIICEQHDLHLCWYGSKMFLKPLSSYLLSCKFWEDYICVEEELHKNGCGLLLSYVWLVKHESDLKIAKEMELVPKSMEWIRWVALVNDILQHIDANTLEKVNKRYQYGELRLNRLNSIYRLNSICRLAPKLGYRDLVRGYHTRYTSYIDFLDNNFKFLLVVFAYVSIVLAAMQVGLGTDWLQLDTTFQVVSYGFAVFSIIVPVIVAGVVLLMLTVLIIYNLVVTLQFGRKREKDRNTWKEEKEQSSNL